MHVDMLGAMLSRPTSSSRAPRIRLGRESMPPRTTPLLTSC